MSNTTNSAPRRRRRSDPDLADEAIALARQLGVIAVRALANIAEDGDAPATARVAAAGKLLERGYGRARTEVAADLAGLSDDQLEELLRGHDE